MKVRPNMKVFSPAYFSIGEYPCVFTVFQKYTSIKSSITEEQCILFVSEINSEILSVKAPAWYLESCGSSLTLLSCRELGSIWAFDMKAWRNLCWSGGRDSLHGVDVFCTFFFSCSNCSSSTVSNVVTEVPIPFPPCLINQEYCTILACGGLTDSVGNN